MLTCLLRTNCNGHHSRRLDQWKGTGAKWITFSPHTHKDHCSSQITLNGQNNTESSISDEEIDAVLTQLDKPRSVTTGPLEEVDYWRYRSKILTAVTEALRTKVARWVIDAWDTLCPEAQRWDRASEIKALMLEAKDNSRYRVDNK